MSLPGGEDHAHMSRGVSQAIGGEIIVPGAGKAQQTRGQARRDARLGKARACHEGRTRGEEVVHKEGMGAQFLLLMTRRETRTSRWVRKRREAKAA